VTQPGQSRARDPGCLFCRIASGDAPSRVAYEDADLVAIHDLHPRAPTHLLLMPRAHIGSAADLRADDGPLLGRLFEVAARIAAEQGIAESGFRIATNVGRDGGQSVGHLHFHLMGGRPFSWPPG
jgi:histidine triad (HIT) family protein